MADFTTGIRQMINPQRKQLRSELFSDFIPGLFDYENMFKAMTSAPMQKQPGGGVGSMRARNDQTMGQYLPGQAPLVASAADQKNLFADILNQSGALGYQLMTMLNQLQAARTAANTSNTGGIGGGLGGLLGGLGL